MEPGNEARPPVTEVLLYTKCCTLICQCFFIMYLAGLGSKPLKSPFKEEKQGQETDGFSQGDLPIIY